MLADAQDFDNTVFLTPDLAIGIRGLRFSEKSKTLCPRNSVLVLYCIQSLLEELRHLLTSVLYLFHAGHTQVPSTTRNVRADDSKKEARTSCAYVHFLKATERLMTFADLELPSRGVGTLR